MRVTRYFLPVILLTVLSIDAYAQEPSPGEALADTCPSGWVRTTNEVSRCGTEEFNLSDVRVGKQLQAGGTNYWPVKAKARSLTDGTVREVTWRVTEDGFGGYKRLHR